MSKNSKSWQYPLLPSWRARHFQVLLNGPTKQHNLNESQFVNIELNYIDISPNLFWCSNCSWFGQWELIQTCSWTFSKCLHHFQGIFLPFVTRYSNYFKLTLSKPRVRHFPKEIWFSSKNLCWNCTSNNTRVLVQNFIHWSVFITKY